ncbi:hypothetical protein WA556_004450 [Blastocystis sp. ATCC 50177/Nand II]
MSGQKLNKRAVLYGQDFSLHNHVEELIVGNNSCNGREWSVLDLSFMPGLRVLQVGDKCFRSVKEVKWIGLSQLESIVIGKRSFTRVESDEDIDFCSHFYLKDCERLKELKIGYYSFNEYWVCRIENVDRLEVIEIGDLIEGSGSFYYASLELKNLPSLKSLFFGLDAFHDCPHAVFENLPELTSIRMIDTALYFNEDDSSNELIMRNLPKLKSLTTEGEDPISFKGVYFVILEDMPSLTTVTLPHAFEVFNLLSCNNIGVLANHPNIPKHNPKANIHSIDELVSMEKSMEVMTVDNNVCNSMEYKELDLSSFSNLKVLEVGDYSFAFVDEVKLIGLRQLERVVIGKRSFVNEDYYNSNNVTLDRKRHFYLKNCERLREMKIGSGSFCFYYVFEIEDVDRLEVIEMGKLEEGGCNFKFASLELKNLPSLKSLLLGCGAFMYCPRAVFENLPELTSIRFGYEAFSFKDNSDSTQLIMRNLPKLTTLTASTSDLVCYASSFMYPSSITLEDMPSLTTVTLDESQAFKYKKTIHTKNITPALERYLSEENHFPNLQ